MKENMTYEKVFQNYLVWYESYKLFYGEYPNCWVLTPEEEKVVR